MKTGIVSVHCVRDRIVLCLSFILCAVLGTGCSSSGTMQDQHVRVMTYNIHHGEGMDQKFDLPRIADVIRAQQPDVVALQEVDQSTGRSSGVDQARELGRLTGMHHAFGQAMAYDGGGYGEGVLSLDAPRSVKVYALPFTEGYEPRAAVVLAFGIGDGDGAQVGYLIASHYQHNLELDRVAQARACHAIAQEIVDRAALAGNPHPLVILAGDLNAQPHEPPMQVFFEAGWRDAAQDHAEPTFPSTVARDDPAAIRIDYVLLHECSDLWQVERVVVVRDAVATDHCGLVVDLRLPPDSN